MSLSRWGAGIVLGASIAVAAATPAGAKTFTPDTVLDQAPDGCRVGKCTLREAVIAANARSGRDEIVLGGGKTYELAISAGGDEDLHVTDPLTVTSSNRKRATVDANGLSRAWTIEASTRLLRQTITGGMTAGSSGGGIFADAPLTISRSRVDSNVAGGSGGGAYLTGVHPYSISRTAFSGNETINDPGAGLSISIGGTGTNVRIDRSRFNGNKSGDVGGGLYVSNLQETTLTRSTIAGNDAVGAGGGIYVHQTNLTVGASTISGNATDGSGGGIRAGASTLRMVNATVAGNDAQLDGGGIFAPVPGSRTLNGVTVAYNTGDLEGLGSNDGGGIRLEAGTFNLDNTIVALNGLGSAGGEPDCSAAAGKSFTTGGNNLLSTGNGCTGLPGSADTINVSSSHMGPLQPNGGPTETIALRAGSSAINRAGPDAPGRDQRGVKRRNPDIGAFER